MDDNDNIDIDELNYLPTRDICIRPDSDSEKDDDNSELLSSHVSRKNVRGEGKAWELVSYFNSEEEAMMEYTDEKLREKNLRKATNNFSTSCNKCVKNFKCKVKGCGVCFRIVVNNSESSSIEDYKIKLETTIADHNHNQIVVSDWLKQREILESIFLEERKYVSIDSDNNETNSGIINLKPSEVLKKFKNKRDNEKIKDASGETLLPDPSMKQIYNLMNSKKHVFKKGGEVSLADIEAFAEEHSKDKVCKNEENMDVPFVLGLDIDVKAQKFRLGLSTWRLLDCCKNFEGMIHSDTTYKVNHEGFPCFLFGRTDKDRSFHTAMVGICSNEDENDFHFLFKLWNDNVENMNPKYIMSDAAGAIPNGAKRVWIDIKRSMCFAHVLNVFII